MQGVQKSIKFDLNLRNDVRNRLVKGNALPY